MVKVESLDRSMEAPVHDAGGILLVGFAAEIAESNNGSFEVAVVKTVPELVGEMAVHDALLVSADS